MKLSDKTYDILKWIAQYLLPAAATLYFALAEIWEFPYGEQISGTIMALDAFLGLLVGLSAKTYNAQQKEIADLAPKKGLLVSEERPFKVIIQMSGEVYDTLVLIAQYILPGLGTLVFAVSGIWGFTIGEQIVGTIAAIDTFLGVILGISNGQYKDAKAHAYQENY